jgi:thiaminase
MNDARQFVQDVRDTLSDIDEQIRNHPYPDLLSRRAASAESLRSFPGHQYHIVTSDLRSFSTVVSRFGHTLSRDFFIGILQGERQGMDHLLVMARRLDMTEDDLNSYEVTAEGFAYATFMAHQALYASAAEIVLGLLVNFAAWGHNCARTSAALRQSCGFSEADTAFLDAFANMPSFEDVALEVIQDGLDHGDSRTRIQRGARLFQAYEKMFWDAMLDAVTGGEASR